MATKLSKRFFIGSITDEHYKKSLQTFRRVQQYRKEHPSSTKRKAIEYFKKLPEEDRLSKNTVLKYWESENEPLSSLFSASKSIRKILRGSVSKVATKDSDILNIILSVYLPKENTGKVKNYESAVNRFDCDLTFAKGDFYRSEVAFPNKCYDKYPEQSPYVGAPIVRTLYDICNPTSEGYEEDHSLSSIIIDLPQEISDSKKRSASTFKDLSDLAMSYYRMLSIADQKLNFASPSKAGGLLVVKVGDIIYKGKTIWLSQIVAELATGDHTSLSKDFCSKIFGEKTFDFELVDKFVHRYPADEIEVQSNGDRSIKANDYFLVFRKKQDPTNILYSIKSPYKSNEITVAYTCKDTVLQKFTDSVVEELRIKRMTPQNSIRLKGPVTRSIINRLKSVYDGPIPIEAKLNGKNLIYFLNEGFVKLKSNDCHKPIGKDGNKKYRPRKEPFKIKQQTKEILANTGVYYIENNTFTSNDLDTEVLIVSDKAFEKRPEKEPFFHGSSKLFDSFDLSHALEGAGKVKYGFGVYVTSKYSSAAHYSASKSQWIQHYVYTVKVPPKRESNYISFVQPVHERIIRETAAKLGIMIPSKFITDGKEFRKFLVKHLLSMMDLDQNLPKSAITLEGEKAASEFLLSIGVDFIEWPYLWSNPERGTNRAILNDKAVKIVRIDSVEIDKKKQVVPNSKKTIR